MNKFRLLLIILIVTIVIVSNILLYFYIRHTNLDKDMIRFFKTDEILNKIDHPSIAVVMWYDSNIKDYAKYTDAINRKFCSQYDNCTFIHSDVKEFNDSRDVSWECIALVKKTLHHKLMNNHKYDYVVWVDADACFNSQEKTFEDLLNHIDHYSDKHFIFSQDRTFIPAQIGWITINAGVFIIRNTQLSRNFIDFIFEGRNCKDTFNVKYLEQSCLTKNYYYIEDYSVRLKVGDLQNWYKNKKSIFIHLPATSRETRVKFFSKYLKDLK